MTQSKEVMQIEYLHGDEGKAFIAKGFYPLDEFMQAIKNHEMINSDDNILTQEPSHLWMRVCRNFQEQTRMYIEARPHSKGAFKCTWVQEY